MKIARIVALIGAFSTLIGVGLSLLLPDLMAWYRLELSTGEGYYLNGLGFLIIRGSLIEREDSLLVLIGGIGSILGAILCIISAIKESKKIGFFGGVFMLLGPILLIIELATRVGDFTTAIGAFVDGLGKGIFWGSWDDGFTFYTWELWIGFYMSAAGGFLGLLGGVAY
jgi:hypothetical protein